MTAEPLTERGLIRVLRRRAAGGEGVRVGIGDDAAVLETAAGALLVATTDLMIEDVHFRRRWAQPADLGWKSLAVNLSDVAAMGARPRWALIGLACPATTTPEEVDAFYTGMLALAQQHGVTLVGGDTSASPSGWFVNLTLLGEAVRPPLLRSGARPGDVVAVTGTLGSSAAGLTLLERGSPPPELAGTILAEVTQAHLRPRPRVVEGQWLAGTGVVTAMMDLSDGLATDLGHIVEASHVGAHVDAERLPIAASTREVARRLGRDAVAWAAGGGEDYELLVTCRPEAFAGLAAGLERDTGARLTAVGEIVAGSGLIVRDAAGRPLPALRGFEHFVTDTRHG